MRSVWLSVLLSLWALLGSSAATASFDRQPARMLSAAVAAHGVASAASHLFLPDATRSATASDRSDAPGLSRVSHPCGSSGSGSLPCGTGCGLAQTAILETSLRPLRRWFRLRDTIASGLTLFTIDRPPIGVA